MAKATKKAVPTPESIKEEEIMVSNEETTETAECSAVEILLVTPDNIVIKRGKSLNPEAIITVAIASIRYPEATVMSVDTEEEIPENSISFGFKRINFGQRGNDLPNYTSISDFFKKVADDFFLEDETKKYFDRMFLQPIDTMLQKKYGNSDIVKFIQQSNPAWDSAETIDDIIGHVIFVVKSLITARISSLQANERTKTICLSAYEAAEDKSILKMDLYVPTYNNILKNTKAEFVVYPFGEVYTLDTVNMGNNPKVDIPEIYYTMKLDMLKAVIPGLVKVLYGKDADGKLINKKLVFKDPDYACRCARQIQDYWKENQ